MSTLKVNNIVAYSGTHVSGTFSGVFSGSFNSNRIDALEAFSSSLDNTFATDLVVNSLSGAFNSFTAALDNTYATDAQLLPILQATRSIELTTGSLIGITNGLMAFTAALDNTYATDAQLLPILHATASLNTYTGSNNNVVARILQTTASLNSKTGSYATTGSNQFNGNQTITGSLIHGLEGNIATGEQSHAEGSVTKAIGNYSHAEGDFTQAIGDYSHAEGQETIASGSYSHAEGYQTIALGQRQHVTGQYNFVSPVQSAFIVGNGIDDSNRNNLIYAAENAVEISGSLNVNGSVNIDNVIKLTPVTNFPTGQAGMLVASASYGKTNLYVYDGSNWKWLVTGSIA